MNFGLNLSSKWIVTVMRVLMYMLGCPSADRGECRVHRSQGHAEGLGEGKRSGERYTLSVCAIASLYFLPLSFLASSFFFSVSLLYFFLPFFLYDFFLIRI